MLGLVRSRCECDAALSDDDGIFSLLYWYGTLFITMALPFTLSYQTLLIMIHGKLCHFINLIFVE